jgi:small conductance mechanosensitive channel
MELIRAALEGAARFVPLLATIVVVIVVLMLVNRILKRRWGTRPDAQFRFQLIMLVATFVGVLAVIVDLSVSDSLRGQLLSLIGIILSAAIALSSTTFIGNIVAGIMLKVIRSARPGDFIALGELTGRITEMDLLHTEVQTEFRDLVTVPNLNMVTQPMKVVRASGTIISAEVSLGYDVPNGASEAIDPQIDAIDAEAASPAHDVGRLKARKEFLLERLAAADERRKAEDSK